MTQVISFFAASISAFAMQGTTASAASATIAVCGPQSGQAYYMAGGVVAAKDAGWHPDRISAGRTTLSRSDSGEYDIVFSDATGGVYSARAEGGDVELHRRSANDMAVVVVYDRVIEIYQFTKQPDGAVTMMQLQSKGTNTLRKGALMVSRCTFARFD